MANSSEYVLFVMGNPLLDIQAKVDEDFLNKYSLKANDAILAAEHHMPIYDELVEKYEVAYVAGGAAQNAARGAQYLLPPNSTVYVGCVSNDSYGEQLRKVSNAAGLRTEYMITEETATGTCAVLITGHHRSMVTRLCAAEKFSVDHLKKPEIWKFVEGAKYYYIEGYFLTVSIESILTIAEHAAENNKLFTMNLSAPFLPTFFKEQMEQTIPYWDIVFGNESEAEAFAASQDWETRDVREIALRIAKLPKKNTRRSRIVVFTQGTLPTIVVTGEGEVKEYPILPVKPEDIVDTNGAGDAFCGGFLGVIGDKTDIDISECVKAGHWLAHHCVQRLGPKYPEPEENIKYQPY
ncbi:uncharacterized protein VTP21DRAFT_8709 [Calcarisporiella thermophila]|uniref:uncharacterized protein n=1 Tax=Calcarisporiella thermophila TaxID=911321 RepID=UPI003744743E